MPGGVRKVVGHNCGGDVFPVGPEFGEAEDLDEDLPEAGKWDGIGYDWGELGGERDEELGRWQRAVYGETDYGHFYGLSEH